MTQAFIKKWDATTIELAKTNEAQTSRLLADQNRRQIAECILDASRLGIPVQQWNTTEQNWEPTKARNNNLSKETAYRIDPTWEADPIILGNDTDPVQIQLKPLGENKYEYSVLKMDERLRCNGLLIKLDDLAIYSTMHPEAHTKTMYLRGNYYDCDTATCTIDYTLEDIDKWRTTIEALNDKHRAEFVESIILGGDNDPIQVQFKPLGENKYEYSVLSMDGQLRGKINESENGTYDENWRVISKGSPDIYGRWLYLRGTAVENDHKTIIRECTPEDIDKWRIIIEALNDKHRDGLDLEELDPEELNKEEPEEPRTTCTKFYTKTTGLNGKINIEITVEDNATQDNPNISNILSEIAQALNRVLEIAEPTKPEQDENNENNENNDWI